MLQSLTRLLQQIGESPLIEALRSGKILGVALVVILVCLIYFFGWLWWYRVQMRGWLLDFKSTYSHRERESLRTERRVMRMYAIPFFALIPAETLTVWAKKIGKRERHHSSSSRRHHHSDAGNTSHHGTHHGHSSRHGSDHHQHHRHHHHGGKS